MERFTDRARSALNLAQEETRLLNHDYIGTEHLLLGLIHEGEGIAAKVLKSLGLSIEPVREIVRKISPSGEETSSTNPSFTPQAKKSSTWPCARRKPSITTTSVPSTCSSVSFAKAMVLPRRCL